MRAHARMCHADGPDRPAMFGHPSCLCGREPPGYAAMPVVLQVLPRLITGGVEQREVRRKSTRPSATPVRQPWSRLKAVSSGRAEMERAERAGHVVLPLNRKDPVSLWRDAASLTGLGEKSGRYGSRPSRAPAWAAWFAVRQRRTPLCDHVPDGPAAETCRSSVGYNAMMAKGSSMIVASGLHGRADLAARTRRRPRSVAVGPRGVDPAVFDPAAVSPDRIAALREPFGDRNGGARGRAPRAYHGMEGTTVLSQAAARMNDMIP